MRFVIAPAPRLQIVRVPRQRRSRNVLITAKHIGILGGRCQIREAELLTGSVTERWPFNSSDKPSHWIESVFYPAAEGVSSVVKRHSASAPFRNRTLGFRAVGDTIPIYRRIWFMHQCTKSRGLCIRRRPALTENALDRHKACEATACSSIQEYRQTVGKGHVERCLYDWRRSFY